MNPTITAPNWILLGTEPVRAAIEYARMRSMNDHVAAARRRASGGGLPRSGRQSPVDLATAAPVQAPRLRRQRLGTGLQHRPARRRRRLDRRTGARCRAPRGAARTQDEPDRLESGRHLRARGRQAAARSSAPGDHRGHAIRGHRRAHERGVDLSHPQWARTDSRRRTDGAPAHAARRAHHVGVQPQRRHRGVAGMHAGRLHTARCARRTSKWPAAIAASAGTHACSRSSPTVFASPRTAGDRMRRVARRQPRVQPASGCRAQGQPS